MSLHAFVTFDTPSLNVCVCVCVLSSSVRPGVHGGGVAERVEWAAEAGLQRAQNTLQHQRRRRVRPGRSHKAGDCAAHARSRSRFFFIREQNNGAGGRPPPTFPVNRLFIVAGVQRVRYTDGAPLHNSSSSCGFAFGRSGILFAVYLKKKIAFSSLFCLSPILHNSIQFICIAHFHKLQMCLRGLYNLYT